MAQRLRLEMLDGTAVILATGDDGAWTIGTQGRRKADGRLPRPSSLTWDGGVGFGAISNLVIMLKE